MIFILTISACRSPRSRSPRAPEYDRPNFEKGWNGITDELKKFVEA
jgi:hypothetical protein